MARPADDGAPLIGIHLAKKHLGDRDLDTLIYSLGIWEDRAFDERYDFLYDEDQLQAIVSCNVTAPILLIKRLLPRLLRSEKSRIILTDRPRGCPGAVART